MSTIHQTVPSAIVKSLQSQNGSTCWLQQWQRTDRISHHQALLWECIVYLQKILHGVLKRWKPRPELVQLILVNPAQR
jgi:hypothetical protein